MPLLPVASAPRQRTAQTGQTADQDHLPAPAGAGPSSSSEPGSASSGSGSQSASASASAGGFPGSTAKKPTAESTTTMSDALFVTKPPLS